LWTWAALTGCIAVAWRWFGRGPVLAFWSCCDQLPDGTFRWTTPSGRAYATEPTRYPIEASMI